MESHTLLPEPLGEAARSEGEPSRSLIIVGPKRSGAADYECWS